MIHQTFDHQAFTLKEARLLSANPGRIKASAAKRVAAAKAPAPKPAPKPAAKPSSSSLQANVAARKDARLQRLEMAARAEVEQDPAMKQQFQAYQDALAQYDSLPDALRKQLDKMIDGMASAASSEYYDEEANYLARQRDLMAQLREFQKQQTIQTAGTRRDRANEDLNLDTGKTLRASLYNQSGRGTLDSGAERSIADEIIDMRTRAGKRVEEDYALTVAGAEKGFNLQSADDTLASERATRQLGFEQRLDQAFDKGDILSDLERWAYLTGGQAATNITSGMPTPTSPKTTKTPADEMIDLRAKATARAQERLPAPAPIAKVPTVTARSAPNTSIQQRAAARGAARASRY